MEEFTALSFAILPAEILVDILKKMKPPSVLKLCQSEIAMAAFCQDDDLFKILCRKHFLGYKPERKETWKDLYVRMTATYVTSFAIPVENGRLQVDLIARQSTDDWGQSDLNIFGDPEEGTKIWVYSVFQDSEAEYQSYAFDTREEAIEGAYEDYVKVEESWDRESDLISFKEFESRIERGVKIFHEDVDGDHDILYTIDQLVLPGKEWEDPSE